MVTLFPGTTRSHRYLQEGDRGGKLVSVVSQLPPGFNIFLGTRFSPVAEQLQVSRHLSVRHGVRRLLQAEGLEVNTHAPIWDDEVRVHRALHPAGILPDKQSTRQM